MMPIFTCQYPWVPSTVRQMQASHMDRESVMTTINALHNELKGRFSDVPLSKSHISIRFEPGPGIVRLGACIDPYNWGTREAILDRIIEFEENHDEFAVEFDIVPLAPVVDPTFAEA